MLQVNDYILFVFLVFAFITDVKYQKLPNWLTAGGMLIGIVYHLIVSGIDGLIFSFIGLLIAGGIFLVLYVFKALGAGDVKLFAALGSMVGIQLVLYIMMYSIVFAGLIAIIILLFTRTFLKKVTNALFTVINSIMAKDFHIIEEYKTTNATRFPFMYAVIPAVIATYYYYLF